MDKRNPKANPPKTTIKEKNIPSELKTLPYWGFWKWKFVNGLWTKVPCLVDGSPINVNQFNSKFKTIYKRYSSGDCSSMVCGMGFYFAKKSNVLGIDFDDCVKGGKVDKSVRKKIEALGSYWEISPSGQGVHVLGLGAKRLNGVDKKFVYAGNRYFTFTGKGSGGLLDIGKKVNKHFARKARKVKGIGRNLGGKHKSLTDLLGILPNIRPDISEPDWFVVCKVIHDKTGGSEFGYELFRKWSTGAFCDKSMRYDRGDEPKNAYFDALRAKWDRCRVDHESPVGFPRLREIEGLNPVNLTLTKRSIYADVDIFKKKLKEKPYSTRQLTLGHLPDGLKKAVKEVSRFNKVSIDAVATTALIILSAAINKKITIIERKGIEHHSSMGVILATESGGRKSAIDKQLMAAYHQYENKLIDDWRKKKTSDDLKVGVLKKRLKKAEAIAVDESEGTDLDIDGFTLREMEKIKEQITQHSTTEPKLIGSDTTEERLSNDLNINNETMFIQSDEARNTVKNIIGRYDSGGSENIYIAGLTNDTYTRARVSGDTNVKLRRPCLNLSLKVQLDLMEELVSKESMTESGLFARLFLKIVDVDFVKQVVEEEGEKDLSLKRLESFNSLLVSFLSSSGGLIVTLDRSAKRKRKAFTKEYAEFVGGRWKGYNNITNKVVSLAVKMACVISSIRNVSCFDVGSESGMISGFKISGNDFEIGKRIVVTLMDQTIDVLKLIRYNKAVRMANELLPTMRNELKASSREKVEHLGWTMTDLKHKKNNREMVEKAVLFLVESEMLISNGNRFFLNG